MNRLSEESNGCPSPETLAEYVDFPESEDIAHHLESCARCRGIYRRHLAIAETLQSVYAPPSDIERKIKAACCKAAQKSVSESRRAWWGRAAAVAALAAICFLTGIVAAPGMRSLGTKQETTVASASKPSTVETDGPVAKTHVVDEATADVEALAVSALQRAMPAPKTLRARAAETAAEAVPAEEVVAMADDSSETSGDMDGASLVAQDVPLHNDLVYARPVAAIGAPAYTFVETNGDAMRVGIAQKVSHVWKIGDDCEWNSLVRETGCNVTETDQSNEAYDVVHITGTDVMLQHLVDGLHQKGAVLYSSEFPQPGWQAKTFFADSKVDYEMKMLK